LADGGGVVAAELLADRIVPPAGLRRAESIVPTGLATADLIAEPVLVDEDRIGHDRRGGSCDDGGGNGGDDECADHLMSPVGCGPSDRVVDGDCSRGVIWNRS